MKVVSPIDYSSGPCHLETAPRLHDWPQPSAECGWSRRACQSRADQAPAVRLLVPATTARPRAAATTGGSRGGLGADHWRQHALLRQTQCPPVGAVKVGQLLRGPSRGRDHLVIAVAPAATPLTRSTSGSASSASPFKSRGARPRSLGRSLAGDPHRGRIKALSPARRKNPHLYQRVYDFTL